MKQLNTPQKKWGCGTIAVVILMVCGAFYLLPQIFGGNNTVNPTDVPDNGGANAQNSSDINLGNLQVSEGINRDGCATSNVSSLSNVASFYVVAPDSAFPNGTTIFARLYRDGTAIEDLPVITANQDYTNSCVNFVFETTNGDNFQSGDYEVEFIVNGNSYDSVTFSIN
jgi:hypothetical protein